MKFNQKAKITLSKEQVQNIMRFLKPGIAKNRNVRAFEGLEVTLKQNKIELNLPGVFMEQACKTEGACKFNVSILFFYDQLQQYRNKESLEILVGEESIKMGAITKHVNVTFFESDKVLRHIKLPVNYNSLDILLLKENYTPEEIKFNRFDEILGNEEYFLNLSIEKSFEKLQKYNVSFEELKSLVMNTIYKND